jgi:peptidylprolyl isomerase
MRFRLLSALVALSLSSACLDTEPLVIPTIETTGFNPSLGVDLAASTKTSSGLYYRDIVDGTGETFDASKKVSVYYVGALPTGFVFDAPSTAFTFTLGVGEVIRGWDEGLVGMKVGGQRQLIIPPSLGYGSQDIHDGTGRIIIPAYSILVFTVTAVSVQ